MEHSHEIYKAHECTEKCCNEATLSQALINTMRKLDIEGLSEQQTNTLLDEITRLQTLILKL